MSQFAFATPARFLFRGSPRGSTCAARRRPNTVASADQWGTPSEWQTAGSGIPQKGLQEIEFIIRQDGTVEEKVTGVRGKDCVKLTEEIEKALGTVVSSEKTEEYFEQEITLNVQNQQQVIQKGDPLYVDPTIPSW